MNEDLCRVVSFLERFIRAFKDNVLAEMSAIKLYQSHIDEFRSEISDTASENVSTCLRKLRGSLSDEKQKREIDRIAKLLDAIVNDGTDRIESIQHVLDEEIEHEKEFNVIIDALSKIRNRLEEIFT